MIPVSLVVEGACDEAVLTALLDQNNIPRGPVFVTGGKSKLDGRLHAYQAAGRFAPWIVLRDLDVDSECAPALLAQLQVRNTRLFRLHIAVRSVEAWLLADRRRFAEFLAVPESRIPLIPDVEADPKQLVVSLARRSRSGRIRADMVPLPDSSARVGRAYTARLVEFALRNWRSSSATAHSRSLASLTAYLRRLSDEV